MHTLFLRISHGLLIDSYQDDTEEIVARILFVFALAISKSVKFHFLLNHRLSCITVLVSTQFKIR